MAVMMYRYAQFKGDDVSAGENINISAYSDYEDISDYALSAIQWTVYSEIISGKTAEIIAPLDIATRAEAAVIIMRMIEK